MPKIDILSPSLFAGLIGYAATGSGVAFWLTAVGLWFALTALIVLAAALARRDGLPTREENLNSIEFAE